MYGKLFERMYTGSMRGRGAMVFAVWPYVIAHMKPNRERSVFTVELNADIMSFLIGEKSEDISAIISNFCEPDPKSRTETNEGRKLIKLGEYLYEVVNGAVYDEIRRESELREYNRLRQKKYYDSKRMDTASDEFVNTSKTCLALSDSVKTPKPTFSSPSVEECRIHAGVIGMPESEGDKFFHFYESKGWKVGKQVMKSWKSAMSGWKLRNTNEGSQRIGQQPKQSVDRNIGNANEGKAHLYKGLGNVSVPG